MSSERSPSPEEHEAAYEFPIGWGGLIVGVLERKVGLNPTNSPDHYLYGLFTRSFSARNGDEILVVGRHFTEEDDAKATESMWWLTITPAASAGRQSRPYGLYLEQGEDEEDTTYQVRQRLSDIVVGPEAEEALLGTLATMVPSGEARYLTLVEQYTYWEDREQELGGPVVKAEVQE